MLVFNKIKIRGIKMASLEQTSSLVLQNTRLSLSEAGKGEAVLCLHGNPGSKSIFSELMTKLEGLNIKLLSIDRPGHNSSEELLIDSQDLWGDSSIYSELIDCKLNKKAWLLGHSYGCLTALKIAIKQPNKVKGLIFINPQIVPDNPKDKVSSIPKWAKGALLGSIFGIWLPNEYQSIFTEILNKMYMPQVPSEDYADRWLQKFTRFESVIAYLTDKNNIISIQKELKEELTKINLPVYALFGEKDAFSDLERQKEAVGMIPSSRIEVCEEAGHYMPLLNPKDCIDFISLRVHEFQRT